MARRYPVLPPVSLVRSAGTALVLATAVALSLGHGPAVAGPPPAVDQQQSGSSSEATGQGSASAADPWAPSSQGSAATLDAPSELRAEATSPTSARLTWRPASGYDQVTGYQVFQQGTSTPVAEVDGHTLTAEVGSLEPGISYTFAVHAVGPDGRASGASQQVELTMPERTAGDQPAVGGV